MLRPCGGNAKRQRRKFQRPLTMMLQVWTYVLDDQELNINNAIIQMFVDVDICTSRKY